MIPNNELTPEQRLSAAQSGSQIQVFNEWLRRNESLVEMAMANMSPETRQLVTGIAAVTIAVSTVEAGGALPGIASAMAISGGLALATVGAMGVFGRAMGSPIDTSQATEPITFGSGPGAMVFGLAGGLIAKDPEVGFTTGIKMGEYADLVRDLGEVASNVAHANFRGHGGEGGGAILGSAVQGGFSLSKAALYRPRPSSEYPLPYGFAVQAATAATGVPGISSGLQNVPGVSSGLQHPAPATNTNPDMTELERRLFCIPADHSTADPDTFGFLKPLPDSTPQPQPTPQTPISPSAGTFDPFVPPELGGTSTDWDSNGDNTAAPEMLSQGALP
jgi:hypothetical protein